MAHAQKPDFVFLRNGRVHLNRRGASVQSATGSRGVRIRGSNAGYTMFRGSVKSTGYPLHSPVSLSLPLPCVTTYHHISIGVYQRLVNNRQCSIAYRKLNENDKIMNNADYVPPGSKWLSKRTTRPDTFSKMRSPVFLTTKHSILKKKH